MWKKYTYFLGGQCWRCKLFQSESCVRTQKPLVLLVKWADETASRVLQSVSLPVGQFQLVSLLKSTGKLKTKKRNPNLPDQCVCVFFLNHTCMSRHHTCVREQEGRFHQAATTQSGGVHPQGAVLEAGEWNGPAASLDQVPVFTVTSAATPLYLR